MIDFEKAADFIWLNARLIDRHRFAHHFLGHDAAPVVTTLRGYRNADGGFGHALDPDLRTPHSGPVATQAALEILEEVGAPDGGWEFDWPHWNPAGAHEWRGAVTLLALRLPRAHGRLH